MSKASPTKAKSWLGAFEDEHDIIDALARRPILWLNAEGEYEDIIISSRVRLARNLKEFLFSAKADREDLLSVLETVDHALAGMTQNAGFVSLRMDNLSDLEKTLLLERRLISPNFARSKNPAGLVIWRDECTSLMINEEDHIRIQAMQSALGLREAWELAFEIDNELGEHLNYAFSEQFGYLTACPTNVGTGLRASIFVHLPALNAAKKIDQVFRELGPREISFRGFYGEGTRVMGDIYQISNQLTLGRVEKRIIDRMILVAKRITELEREARVKLLKKNRIKIEDRVFRAVAVLQAAKLLESKELLQLLSDLRLGTSLEIIQAIDYSVLNELIVITQPAHLQKIFNKTMDANERDEARANFVRQRLSL